MSIFIRICAAIAKMKHLIADTPQICCEMDGVYSLAAAVSFSPHFVTVTATILFRFRFLSIKRVKGFSLIN
jgi:hypothetical protein